MRPLRLVRVEPFALSELGRKFGLSGVERNVLNTMTLQADWRSQEWKGTVTDLATETGHGRRSVAAAVPRLVELGLVQMLRPFRQRAEGWVAILCYCDLVDPERCKPVPHSPADIAPEARPEIRHEPLRESPGLSRRNRALNAPESAIDQGEGGVPKAIRNKEALRGTRVEVASDIEALVDDEEWEPPFQVAPAQLEDPEPGRPVVRIRPDFPALGAFRKRDRTPEEALLDAFPAAVEVDDKASLNRRGDQR